MIRVAALTSGRTVPSSRFRVRQHVEPLRDHGVEVEEFVPRIEKYAPVPGRQRLPLRLSPSFYGWQGLKMGTRVPGLLASWRSQVTWLERELLPGRRTLEPWLGEPLVFDVDDAIWLASPRAADATARIAREAAMVVAGNRYLADWLSRWSPSVTVIPTAIDIERFHPRDSPRDPRDLVIGWTGSAATLPYLEALEDPLRRLMRDSPAARLVVVADRPPALRTLPAERVRFIPWSPAVEASAVRQFDVGIMPLPDSEWSRGKCSFKMLQYMACGIPVVVSPVGMNAEVLRLGEVGVGVEDGASWDGALAALAADPVAARRMGEGGRRVVEQHFSRAVVAQRLAGVFSTVVKL
jgi:glycosyltransferase involved in cell wall biosynthesis